MADINIIATPIGFNFTINASLSIKVVSPNQTFQGTSLYFKCESYDANGEPEIGYLYFNPEIAGTWLNYRHEADPITFSPDILADLILSKVFSGTLWFGFGIEWATTDLLLERFKDSWVKWGQIGHANFDIGRDNIAGESPMDWKGMVYEIIKFRNKVMVYGENGVTQLIPSGNAFGLNTILRLGLKSRHSVAGTDDIHYFIDVLGQMWKLGDSLEKLDYSEYLSVLKSPVMQWDNEKDLIYICDGNKGFVYSPDSNSLAEGPPNVCGIFYQSGRSFVTSPKLIEIPLFELTTDIYDFGTRKEKTIFGLEFSLESIGDLQVRIEYRTNTKDPFRDFGWHNVNPDGKINLPCYGVEFRFSLRNLTYEYFELDQMKINGVIHGFSHLDIQG